MQSNALKGFRQCSLLARLIFFREKISDFRATAAIKQQRLLCYILYGADLVAAGGMWPRHYDANGGDGGDRRRRTS